MADPENFEDDLFADLLVPYRHRDLPDSAASCFLRYLRRESSLPEDIS